MAATRRVAAVATAAQALAFVRRHGVVLASARGPVPSLAEAVAGAPIRGGWWGHPRGQDIFRILQAMGDSRDVLVCRLVAGKVTLVHRRLWPALARASAHFPKRRLARVEERHAASGRHVTTEIPFPDWAPRLVLRQAQRLAEDEALTMLGSWTTGAARADGLTAAGTTRPRARS
jgi:hypothetical protein